MVLLFYVTVVLVQVRGDRIWITKVILLTTCTQVFVDYDRVVSEVDPQHWTISNLFSV